MTKIKITTTQNIEIEYELATIFDRILAWLIDIAIIGVYGLIAFLVSIIIAGDISRGLVSVLMLPGLFYHLAMEVFFKGKSVGKMALGISVVRLDGSPPNVGNYLTRWIFRVIETNPIIFYGSIAVATVAFSKKGQRLGDMISGTTVIRPSAKVGLQDTILAKANEGYEAMFPQVKKLDDIDMGTIKDVLRLSRSAADLALINACANRICNVLEVKPAQGMNAEQFLRIILRDYSHLH